MQSNEEALSVQVVRVTMPDTLLLRVQTPVTQGHSSIYVRLFGVECASEAKQAIVDWAEVHPAPTLLVADWLRDCYGRLLGDLVDGNSSLCEYLVAQGCAEEKDDHYGEVVGDLLRAEEPE